MNNPQIAGDKTMHSCCSGSKGKATNTSGKEYFCPMHSEVTQPRPGDCPKCGMALEPKIEAPSTSTEYTCPMHPEIVKKEPGDCPNCGMPLELRSVTSHESNAELKDMSRRFWASLILSIPVVALAMGEMILHDSKLLSGHAKNWLQLIFTTPVVLWGGWSFFKRGWASIVNRNLNMSTFS